MVEVTLSLPQSTAHAFGETAGGEGVFIPTDTMGRIRNLANEGVGRFVVTASDLIGNQHPKMPWKLGKRAVRDVRKVADVADEKDRERGRGRDFQDVIVVVPSAHDRTPTRDFLLGWTLDGQRCRIAESAAEKILRKVGQPGNYAFRVALVASRRSGFVFEVVASSRVGDRLDSAEEIRVKGEISLNRKKR